MTSRVLTAAQGNFGTAPRSFKHNQWTGIPPVTPAFPTVALAAVTITIASPGVVTWNAHGLIDGRPIVLSTTVALPTGLVAGTTYYVVNSTPNTFQLSATVGGAAINTSGSQSGVHTAKHNLTSGAAGETSDEQTNVRAYLQAFYGVEDPTNPVRTRDTPFNPHTSPDTYSAYAQTKIAAFDAYFATPAYVAWLHQNNLSRDGQWRIESVAMLEALVASGTVSASLDPAGNGLRAPSGIATARKLLAFTASALDLSGGVGTERTDNPYAVDAGGNFYITGIIFSIFAASPSTGQHLVEIRRNASGTPKWKNYMPQPTSAQPVSILAVNFDTPIILDDSQNLFIVFTTIAGTVTGYKGAYALQGYWE